MKLEAVSNTQNCYTDGSNGELHKSRRNSAPFTEVMGGGGGPGGLSFMMGWELKAAQRAPGISNLTKGCECLINIKSTKSSPPPPPPLSSSSPSSSSPPPPSSSSSSSTSSSSSSLLSSSSSSSSLSSSSSSSLSSSAAAAAVATTRTTVRSKQSQK